jgi:hypothetical protein
MPKKRIHRPSKRMRHIEEFVNSDGMVQAEVLFSDAQQTALDEHMDLFFAAGKRAFKTYGRGVVDVDFVTPGRMRTRYCVESDYNAEYLPQIQNAIRTYDPMTQIVLRIQFVLPPDIYSPREDRITSVWDIFTQGEQACSS